MKRQLYFTDRQIHQMSHAINHTKFALFQDKDCKILNDSKLLKQIERSLDAASGILLRESMKEKIRRRK